MNVRRAALAAVAALALAGAVGAQEAPPSPGGNGPPATWRMRADEVNVTYKIEAHLVEKDAHAWRIVGDETIFWKNASRDPVKVVYLHAYANAFRNTRSTLLREAMRDGFDLPDDMTFGSMQVTRLTAYDDELTSAWVAPDDGNADDRTVLRAELRESVEPGETLNLRVGFTLDLPRAVVRMGGGHGFVMAAQWYPKLGRYLGLDSEAKNVREGWYCHQYHAHCEFAADFADYDVTLRLPSHLVLGATGHPVGDDAVDEKAGTRTRRYRAESVVDFAWAADARFQAIERDVSPVDPGSLTDPVSLEWRRRKSQFSLSDADAALPTVKVVLLVQPDHADQADRFFEAARVALGCFGTWLGPYPYGRLTIVDPPWSSAAAGGMEYPMLVTTGSSVGSPEASLRPEFVTVHEICHQWAMGILANNEAEEAWLDEGLDTYLTAHAMHLAYGPARRTSEILGFHYPTVPFVGSPGLSAVWPSSFGLPEWTRPPDLDALRLWGDLPPLTYVTAFAYRDDPLTPMRARWIRRAEHDEMIRSSWTYFDAQSYGVNAYFRPALFLNTLRRGLAVPGEPDAGDRKFFEALRAYAREQRFRHPTTEDFLRTFREHAADPSAAVEQLVRSASSFDYLVESVRRDVDPPLRGLDDAGKLHSGDAVEPPPKKAGSIVRVRRRGDAAVGVVVEARRKDGGVQRIRWEPSDQSRPRWRDLRFEGEVVAVTIDPDRVYLQDLDLSNNAHSVDANARPALKWSVRFAGWLENALLSYGRLF